MLSMYAEIIRIRFLTMLAYRVNYYSGIIVYSINIGAYYFLWNAIYGGQSTMGGFSAQQMVTYVAISWMARAFYFNNIDREMALDIKEGKVAIEMIRPYNYLTVKLMQGFGEGIFRLLFFSVPGMLVISLIFPIDYPDNPEIWGWYTLSLLISFVINTQINLITGLMTFFFYNNEGIMRAKRVIVDLFSGLILPISFYPGWAQEILKFMPFQAISYLPGMIFTEAMQGEKIYSALLIQIAWMFGLLLPIWFMWWRARKNVIIQGG
ncbi:MULTISPECIES: ABC transporter permease [Aneurinibacillus]|uniref:ABC-2 type transport system permease protein n=1 Tax=Aneurinibacillus thermoaerophilus TaxID=143495 RepID=A0A1G8A8K2_ANETH|nr:MULTISPECIES: ABC-2 family transporter protein [Aneurinibacillus]MED0675435.1 ABC-2 family transporter protein [Aneurinibacillus thermoaerophilus]MED0678789.1 ABC-2 family transporter protein [Aneurinibacillus thermoaerophilus]MED0736663.1 ABC-2 family transporter protein [Aneurinibacillus thermoaerophilus]MED0758317.1 ABC-2 family transporter protein [Aneurinibacillus thermoaerophilus]MED0759876.1 ABC-2 family transporter protein [Aneurinibacillus thermoaerophilus]